MSDISSWSETAASNNNIPPAGFPEGMSPATVNDAAREVMAAVKRTWDRDHPIQTSTGAANSYNLTYTNGPAGYVLGESYTFIAGATNTDVSTLNVNSIGAVAIKSGDGVTPLVAGIIVAGYQITCVYNGSSFQLVGGFTFTGDVTGTGTGTAALTLAPSGVTAGVYVNLTIDAKGRVTAARNLNTLDVAGVLGTASVFNVGGAGAVVPLLSGVNTWSGIQTFSSEVDLVVPTGAVLSLASNAGVPRIIYFATLVSSVPKLRWSIDANTAAETGTGNAGSNFDIVRYNDAGTPFDTPLTISRSTGQITTSTSLNVTGQVNATTHVVATNNIVGANLYFGNGTFQVGSNAVGNKFVFPTSSGVPGIGATSPGAVGDIWYEW